MAGNQLQQLMWARDRPRYWNVLDVDARLQPGLTDFTLPDAVKSVSLNELLGNALHEEFKADREANYLLISEAGAITLFHQDMTGTCVFYFLVEGCKTFYVARPSDTNQGLFNALVHNSRRDIFFGGSPDLDAGGCQKIVLRAREAVCMPVGMIHAVETTGFSVALG